MRSVTPEMVDGWCETSPLTLLSNYELKEICNADEFELFYEWLPNKIYQLNSEQCSGGKLKHASQAWQPQIPSEIRPKSNKASRTWSFYSVFTKINEKVGWMEYCLKSGSVSWTRSLFLKEEKLWSTMGLSIVKLRT